MIFWSTSSSVQCARENVIEIMSDVTASVGEGGTDFNALWYLWGFNNLLRSGLRCTARCTTLVGELRMRTQCILREIGFAVFFFTTHCVFGHCSALSHMLRFLRGKHLIICHFCTVPEIIRRKSQEAVLNFWTPVEFSLNFEPTALSVLPPYALSAPLEGALYFSSSNSCVTKASGGMFNDCNSVFWRMCTDCQLLKSFPSVQALHHPSPCHASFVALFCAVSLKNDRCLWSYVVDKNFYLKADVKSNVCSLLKKVSGLWSDIIRKKRNEDWK